MSAENKKSIKRANYGLPITSIGEISKRSELSAISTPDSSIERAENAMIIRNLREANDKPKKARAEFQE